MHSAQIEYNPQLQGLRAIAVLLVLGSHAAVPVLSGGFIGVDMFFVLSGYLITGILLSEYRKTQNINLSKFCFRRFKRLAPGLLSMILLSSLFMSLVLTTPDLHHQSAAAASASIWVSNLYFALSDLNYFEAEQTPSVFLHTWSLGVEEQFYLIWPLMLVAISRFRPANTTILLTIIFAVSLTLCLWIAFKTPVLSFYMMPTRMWQFAAGAIVWMWLPSIRKNPQWSSYFYLAAATLLLLALATVHEERAYPDLLALLPTAATASLLAATASDSKGFTAHALGSKPLTFIGNLSYSLYLWHWPTIVLGLYILGEDTPSYRLKLVLLSIPLAWLSYRLIEKPCREAHFRKPSSHLQLLLVSLLILSVGTLLFVWQQHLTVKHNNLMTSDRILYEARTNMSEVYKRGCDQWYTSSEVVECTFGSAKAHQTAVLWGDSIGTQWYPAIRKALDEQAWRIIVITKSSCPIVNRTVYLKAIGRDFVECDVWRMAAAARIKEIAPDLLFIGSGGTYPFSEKEWANGSRILLNAVHNSARKIIIIAPTMPLGFNGPDCIAGHGGTQQVASSIINVCSATANPSPVESGWLALKQTADRFANIKILDLNNQICPYTRCRAMVGQEVVYRDAQHITAGYAESLSSIFRQAALE
jgi:peptidoglycan/LPS O-acetylase OafA/YrhL